MFLIKIIEGCGKLIIYFDFFFSTKVPKKIRNFRIRNFQIRKFRIRKFRILKTKIRKFRILNFRIPK